MTLKKVIGFLFDNNLDNQHNILRKFSKCWFGLYMAPTILDNTTYLVKKLDRTRLKVTIVEKWVKILKQE